MGHCLTPSSSSLESGGFLSTLIPSFSVAIVSALIANERAPRFEPNLLDLKERDDAVWTLRSRIEEENDEDEEAEEEIRVWGVNTGLAIIGIREEEEEEEEASRRAEH